MRTSSPELARRLLDTLSNLGFEFAVLHNEEGIMDAKPLSDVDVVSLLPPSAVLPGVVQGLIPQQLRLVMHWEYDLGGLSTFWLDESGLEGVQLDIMHDPEGRGRYGLRSQDALRRAVSGVRYPRLSDADRLGYLAIKRYRKGDVRGAQRVVQEIRDSGLKPSGAFSPRGEKALGRVLGGQVMGRSARRLARSTDYISLRAMRRLKDPVGVVATVGGANLRQLHGVASRLSNVLVGAMVLDNRAPGSLALGYHRRFRPFVIVQPQCYLRPDIIIEWVDNESAALTSLVGEMALLESRRLGTSSWGSDS